MATLRANFASNLKRLLRGAGISQRALAEKLGVSETAVSHWTSAANFPEDRHIDRIAQILGVGFDEMFADPKAVPDQVLKFLKELARQRGYDMVKKS